MKGKKQILSDLVYITILLYHLFLSGVAYAYPSGTSLPVRRKKVAISSYSFINVMRNVESALTKDKYSNRTKLLVDNFTKIMDRMFLYSNCSYSSSSSLRKPSYKISNHNNNGSCNTNNSSKKKNKVPLEETAEAKEIRDLMEQVKNHNTTWQRPRRRSSVSVKYHSNRSSSRDSFSVDDDDYLSDITNAMKKEYQIYEEIRSYDEASEMKRKKLKPYQKSSKVLFENNDGVDIRNFLPEITTAVELNDYLTYLPEYQPAQTYVFDSIQPQKEQSPIVSPNGSLTDVNFLKEPQTEITAISESPSDSTILSEPQKSLHYKAEWKFDQDSNFILEVTPEELNPKQIYVKNILSNLENLQKSVENVSRLFVDDCRKILKNSSSPNFLIKNRRTKNKRRRKRKKDVSREEIRVHWSPLPKSSMKECENIDEWKLSQYDDIYSVTSQDTFQQKVLPKVTLDSLFSISFPWQQRIFVSPLTGRLVGYRKCEYMIIRLNQIPRTIQSAKFEVELYFVIKTFLNPYITDFPPKVDHLFITHRPLNEQFENDSWISKLFPIWSRFPEQYLIELMNLTVQEFCFKKLKDLYDEMSTIVRHPLKC